jgi:voltage-gated potassium channel
MSRSAHVERERTVRVFRAALLVGLVLILGTMGFNVLTQGAHTLFDCFYKTVLTISTVGYREVIPIGQSMPLQIFTVGLIFLGGGSILYFLSSFTAMVIEGDLAFGFWRRHMERRLGSVRDHVIVAGSGRSGVHVLRELLRSNIPVVALDSDPERMDTLLAEFGEALIVIVGDALEESVLRAAGLERARGVIACLHDDRDNLFLCLTARQMGVRARIVAKADDPHTAEKFRKVGVDAVVSPGMLGGRRLVSEMLTPEMSSFADALMAPTERLKLAEVTVGGGAPLSGRTIAEARNAAQQNCAVLGLRDAGGESFVYQPPSSERLNPGATLIVLAEHQDLTRLQRLLAGA